MHDLKTQSPQELLQKYEGDVYALTALRQMSGTALEE